MAKQIIQRALLDDFYSSSYIIGVNDKGEWGDQGK